VDERAHEPGERLEVDKGDWVGGGGIGEDCTEAASGGAVAGDGARDVEEFVRFGGVRFPLVLLLLFGEVHVEVFGRHELVAPKFWELASRRLDFEAASGDEDLLGVRDFNADGLCIWSLAVGQRARARHGTTEDIMKRPAG